MSPKRVGAIVHDTSKVKAFTDSLTAESFPTNCSECDAKCSSAKSMLQHLVVHAKVPVDACVHLKSLRNAYDIGRSKSLRTSDGRGADGDAAYPKESTYMSPDPTNHLRAICNDPRCNRPIAKRDIVPHYTKSKAHIDNPLPYAQLSQWTSVADGNRLKHAKLRPKTIEEVTTFEAACLLEKQSQSAHEPGHAPVPASDAAGELVDAHGQHPQAHAPIAAEHAPIAREQPVPELADDIAPIDVLVLPAVADDQRNPHDLTAIVKQELSRVREDQRHFIGTLQALLPKKPDVEPPPDIVLTLSDDAKGVMAAYWTRTVKRHPWPVRKRSHPVAIDEYTSHSLQSRVSGDTHEKDITCLNNFLKLFDYPEGVEVHPHNVVKAIYDQNLYPEIVKLPIWDTSVPSVYQCWLGLARFIEWVENDSSIKRWSEHERCAKLLNSMQVQLTREKLLKEKRLRRWVNVIGNRQKSDILKEHLDQILEACSTTILDLHHFLDMHKSDSDTASLTPHQQFCANTLVAGLIQFGCIMGRPGGWSDTSKDHLEEQHKKFRSYFIMMAYKTIEKYGPRGIHMQDALWYAIGMWFQLPGAPSTLFFKSARKNSFGKLPKFHFAGHISKWMSVYGLCAATPTVVRDLLSNEFDDDTSDAALRLLCGADKHTLECAKKYYSWKVPAEQAKISEQLYMAMFERPIRMPSPQEIEDRKEESLERLRTKFGRQPRHSVVGDEEEVHVQEPPSGSKDDIFEAFLRENYHDIKFDAIGWIEEPPHQLVPVGCDGDMHIPGEADGEHALVAVNSSSSSSSSVPCMREGQQATGGIDRKRQPVHEPTCSMHQPLPRRKKRVVRELHFPRHLLSLSHADAAPRSEVGPMPKRIRIAGDRAVDETDVGVGEQQLQSDVGAMQTGSVATIKAFLEGEGLYTPQVRCTPPIHTTGGRRGIMMGSVPIAVDGDASDDTDSTTTDIAPKVEPIDTVTPFEQDADMSDLYMGSVSP